MAFILSALSPGSTISLKCNGSAHEFIVLHQGNPDPGLYDASCDGTWLMMKDVCNQDKWGDSLQYADSYASGWLNAIFLKYFDADVQELIRSVKLPYVDNGTVRSGADGLDCKIFLLSPYELGWSAEKHTGMLIDGASLDYFKDFEEVDARRIATCDGTPTTYWTRSPDISTENTVWMVYHATGECGHTLNYSATIGYRPAFILPSALSVDDDGSILPNTPPVLSSPSGTSGTNLGIRNTPFLLEYTASDPEGGSLTLTEQLDSQTTRTLTAASGAPQHFEALKNNASFSRLANGAHTLQVTASDSQKASVSLSMTFTKAVTSASLTMTQPMTASAPITVAALTVGGQIPADADYTAEVTNNALDPQPVWQDVTAEVREGQNILFANRTAEKSPAFNFRIQASRGTSGTGGYIDRVTGAFQ